MDFLSDAALARLREVSELPDLSGSRYRLLEPIGRGGMGAVYLVEDGVLQRAVAMKVLHGLPTDGAAAQRLRQEALILAQLEHPGIVPVHDAGTLPDGRTFYVMKHVRGRRLDGYAAEGPPLHERLEIFRRICETVASAHAAGVVHRDLKPENIMVGAFGEVVVMDWGVAKLLSPPADGSGEPPPPGGGAGSWEASALAGGARSASVPAGQSRARAVEPPPPAAAAGLTLPGTVLGTPGYMAPEQARGEVVHISPQTDVFALGAILHFLISRSPPPAAPAPPAGDGVAPTREGGPDSHAIAPGAPRPLRAICRKAMATHPAERYASALLLADDVSRFLARLPVDAHRESVWGATQRLAARYRVALWIVGAYVLMRLILIVGFRA
jgi:serine/threonine protein kinase